MSELDDKERERVKQLVERHRQVFPEGDQFFRDLFALGMVPGWRALLEVRPDNKENN